MVLARRHLTTVYQPCSQSNFPPVSSKIASKQLKKAIICPICSDAIEDATGRKKKGHDSIFGEGKCQEWIHWQCAGLSKAAFQKASSSDYLFNCPCCLIYQQSRELTALKRTVQSLSNELSDLKSEVSPLSNLPTQVPSTPTSTRGKKFSLKIKFK